MKKTMAIGGHFARKCPPKLLSKQAEVVELQGIQHIGGIVT